MSILTSLVEILIIVALSFVIIKKMHGKLYDKSIRRGLMSGLTTVIVYIAFSCSVNALTKGENFVTYWETHETVNGISFNLIKTLGVFLATFVPILLCRYKNIKEFLKYVISACLTYVILYMFVWVTIYIVVFIGFATDIVIKFPLNSFDSMFFALMYFPVGSLVGTLISIVINLILNSQLKSRKY